jgi:hypothetical protein
MIARNIMPAKLFVRMVLIMIVALLASIPIGVFGDFSGNQLTLIILLFMAGGFALNIVIARRWYKQRTDSGVSLESLDNDLRQRLTRSYGRWLIAMPFLYILGFTKAMQMPLSFRILFTAFSICAFSYVWFLYKRTKLP